MPSELPTGTVTFVFTDIEGSTQLAQRLGVGYSDTVATHFELLRSCVADESGTVVNTTGDGVFAVFESASPALRCAASMQSAISAHTWPEGAEFRVRIGVHSGEAALSGDDYLGVEVHRAARIMSAGHGGQVVVSQATRLLAGAGFEFRSLGRHFLRGLDSEETLSQLVVAGLPSDFPPIKTAAFVSNNLPVRNSSIVGRDQDIQDVMALLKDNRTVTILGPGGVGKTSLAVTVGARVLERFQGGVRFVDLSSTGEATFVVTSIAEAVGAEEKTIDGVVGALGDASTLLIIDNFEHVIGSATQIESLIGRCPSLSVLVTSQVPLRIAGEQRFQLGPLDTEPSAGSPGVLLFTERARAVDSTFHADPEQIAELVSMLDALPLAIELAAPLTNLLSTEEMIKRLGSGAVASRGASASPERHRSVDAALEWSHELLDPDLKAAFRRLAVFAGEMALSAAEEIAGDETFDPLWAIGELVDRSLLHRKPGSSARFHMFNAVRQFGRNRLVESGEDIEVRERYVGFYCAMAAEARDGLQSDRGEWWRVRIDEELVNIRDVLGLLHAAGDADRGLALIGNIWRALHSSGRLIELELWLDRFFGLPELDRESLGYIKGLMARGALKYWIGEWESAIADYEEAVAGARLRGDEALLADAVYGLAASQVIASKIEDAAPTLEEAENMYRKLGDLGGLADIVAGEAFMTIREKGLIGVGPALERAGELYSQAGRHLQATQCVVGQAAVAIAEERLVEARLFAEEAMRRSLELNDIFLQTWVLEYFARISFDVGDVEASALYAGAAKVSRSQIGGGWSPEMVGLSTAGELLTERFGDEEYERMSRPGREMPFADAVAMAVAGGVSQKAMPAPGQI